MRNLNKEMEDYGLFGFVQMIRKYYDEPHRAYHNWSHILHGAASIKREQGFDLVLLLAWLCHDLVYVPNCPDNEKNSVSLMCLLLKRYSPDFYATQTDSITKACDYILATKTHELLDTSDERLAILLDADMAYLAESETFFDRARANIRLEFCAFNDEEFRIGSAAFFTELLDKTPLFYSAAFVARDADGLAKTNMKRALAHLEND